MIHVKLWTSEGSSYIVMQFRGFFASTVAEPEISTFCKSKHIVGYISGLLGKQVYSEYSVL